MTPYIDVFIQKETSKDRQFVGCAEHREAHQSRPMHLLHIQGLV